MRRALLVLLLLTAFAAGAWFAGALTTLQAPARGTSEGQDARPQHLQKAWRAFERDRFDALDQALEALRRDPPTDPGFAAEAELIALLRAGDRTAVRAFADRNQGVSAGAAALQHLIATSKEPAARDDLLALLRARYPRTWRGEARTK